MQKRNLIATRLEVTSMVAGGDGLAHVVHGDERRAVFVPRGAPGDVLEAEVDFTCKPARATSIRLLEPSRLRASAPCPHVERCGGCDFMHLKLEAQVAAHRDIVAAALTRAIRSSNDAADTMPEVVSHTAPRDVGYRTRARLSVVAARGPVTVGYRRAGSHRIEEVSSCAVLDPLLDASWKPIRELFAGEKGEGEVGIAIGKQGAPVLDIQWSDNLSGAFFGRLSVNVDNGTWAGGEVWLEGARDPARVGDPRAVTTGADGAPLTVPSGGFAQAHPAMNQKLGERIAAGFPVEGRDVVELFAGSGNLTVVIARNAGSVLAVETEARAVAAARENLQARGLQARVVQADAGAFGTPRDSRGPSQSAEGWRGRCIGEGGSLSGSTCRLCLLRCIDPRARCPNLGFGGISTDFGRDLRNVPAHQPRGDSGSFRTRPASKASEQVMITEVDEQFRREVQEFDLKCTCDFCGAFELEQGTCAYGFPTEPHRRLPMIDEREFRFCKAFELAR